VPWQRCQFHLQQNAQAYVPKQEMKAQAAADLRAIFTATDRQAAETLLRAMVKKYAETAPKLVPGSRRTWQEGLTVFLVPEAHRRLLRTTNGLERVNKKWKRRTRVATRVPPSACLWCV
jgi:transposase-like protein